MAPALQVPGRRRGSAAGAGALGGRGPPQERATSNAWTVASQLLFSVSGPHVTTRAVTTEEALHQPCTEDTRRFDDRVTNTGSELLNSSVCQNQPQILQERGKRG